jgi:hypothetical protein
MSCERSILRYIDQSIVLVEGLNYSKIGKPSEPVPNPPSANFVSKVHPPMTILEGEDEGYVSIEVYPTDPPVPCNKNG